MAIIDYVTPFAMNALHSIWLVAGFLLPMLLMEIVLPARKLHAPTTVFNFIYAPVYLTLAALLLHPIASAITPLVPLNFLGISLNRAPWWKVLLLVLGYLAVFDFFYYWLHRAQHRWPFLWYYHQFHHADINVSVSTATRHHWIEETARYFVLGIPITVLFGHPDQTLPWLGIVIGVYGLFIHWNSPLRLGVFTRLFVGPQYHRLHHSFAPEHIDKNFAVFFPFWDALFRTQSLPHADEFPETGVPGVKNPNGLSQLLPYRLPGK